MKMCIRDRDEADWLDGYQFLEHEPPSFLIEADRRGEVAQKRHGAPTGDGAGGRADVYHGLHALLYIDSKVQIKNMHLKLY